jgi:hypothetical protein
MKFLMTYQQNPNLPPPSADKMKAIGDLTVRNIKSGKLVMTGGLVRPQNGVQVKCTNGKFSHTDGPFAETKELIDGFALVNVSSKEEALAMCAEFMGIAGDGAGELLQVFEMGEGQPTK